MEKKKWVLSALMAAVLLLGLAPTAMADDDGSNDVDPEAIAKACIKRVNRAADRCIAANDKDADRTVKVIRKLLAEGKVKLARRVARRAVRRIARRSDLCVRYIKNQRNRCVRRLLRLGEPELARRVAAKCNQRIKDVRKSEVRAIAKIRRAFPNTSTVDSE